MDVRFGARLEAPRNVDVDVPPGVQVVHGVDCVEEEPELDLLTCVRGEVAGLRHPGAAGAGHLQELRPVGPVGGNVDDLLVPARAGILGLVPALEGQRGARAVRQRNPWRHQRAAVALDFKSLVEEDSAALFGVAVRAAVNERVSARFQRGAGQGHDLLDRQPLASLEEFRLGHATMPWPIIIAIHA